MALKSLQLLRSLSPDRVKKSSRGPVKASHSVVARSGEINGNLTNGAGKMLAKRMPTPSTRSMSKSVENLSSIKRRQVSREGSRESKIVLEEERKRSGSMVRGASWQTLASSSRSSSPVRSSAGGHSYTRRSAGGWYIFKNNISLFNLFLYYISPMVQS